MKTYLRYILASKLPPEPGVPIPHFQMTRLKKIWDFEIFKSNEIKPKKHEEFVPETFVSWFKVKG